MLRLTRVKKGFSDSTHISMTIDLSPMKTNNAVTAFQKHNLNKIPKVRMDFNIKNNVRFIDPPASAKSIWPQKLVDPLDTIEVENLWITFLE